MRYLKERKAVIVQVPVMTTSPISPGMAGRPSLSTSTMYPSATTWCPSWASHSYAMPENSPAAVLVEDLALEGLLDDAPTRPGRRLRARHDGARADRRRDPDRGCMLGQEIEAPRRSRPSAPGCGQRCSGSSRRGDLRAKLEDEHERAVCRGERVRLSRARPGSSSTSPASGATGARSDRRSDTPSIPASAALRPSETRAARGPRSKRRARPSIRSSPRGGSRPFRGSPT